MDAFREAQNDLLNLRYEVSALEPSPTQGWDLRDQMLKLIDINANMAEATRRHLQGLSSTITELDVKA